MLLWAEAASEATNEAANGAVNGAAAPNPFGFGGPMFIWALFGLAFVMLFILPGRRQRKEQEQLLASLKPGVKIVTNSGIVGTIVKMKDGEDEITIRSEDTRLRVLRSTVARVLGTDESESK